MGDTEGQCAGLHLHRQVHREPLNVWGQQRDVTGPVLGQGETGPGVALGGAGRRLIRMSAVRSL